MPTIDDVRKHLESLISPALAESWDNVGLLLGDPAAPCARIMTCLTVTPAVVEEAVREGASLIISHHPMFFKPVQRITTSQTEGGMVWRLARAGIAVYSPHTAFDNCAGGINEQLAGLLHLQEIKPLIAGRQSSQVKIVVFVPQADLEPVSQALFGAGAGNIGNYGECSFRVSGTGTFFGREGADPTIGKAGQREEVAEYRLEVVCPAGRIEPVIHAIRSAHSYEEPAIDVYPLQPLPNQQGSGRMGNLARPLTGEELARHVASALGQPTVWLTGNRNRGEIRRLAIVCGAGGSLLSAAIQAGADAFLTGEMRFHDELAAQAAGMAVVVAGHYATERPGVESLARQFAESFPQLRVWASESESNPCVFVQS